VRFWVILILLGALLLLGIGSGAVAHTSSPPNESIAAAGPAGIDLIDARASGLRLIARSEQAEATTWSPNRDVLAFALRNRSEVDVYSVRADGTSLRLVSRNASSPSWSPDGGQLVVLRESCAQEPCSSTEEFDTGNLFVVDADGDNTRQLTFGADGLEAPVWSPDGSWIAFLGADGIELVRPEDRKSHRRLGIAPVTSDLSWSPDGIWLAFVDLDGIYRVRPGFEPQRLNGEEYAEHLAWSPDGSKIAFDYSLDEWGWDVDVAVLDVETGDRTNLTKRPLPDFAPAWSSDGKQIAFLHDTGSILWDCCGWGLNGDVWVMNADGTNLRPLVKGCYGPPAWRSSNHGETGEARLSAADSF
jgi:Tol biopolymer transport system component